MTEAVNPELELCLRAYAAQYGVTPDPQAADPSERWQGFRKGWELARTARFEAQLSGASIDLSSQNHVVVGSRTCGGCGNSDPNQRCMGCHHAF